MKLYITEGSPYARIARVLIIEKELQSRVEIIFAQTRSTNSPYYHINPSGRVGPRWVWRRVGVGGQRG